MKRDYTAIHKALIADLRKKLPEGVPQDSRTKRLWPETWGEIEKGKVVRWGETGSSYCLQCLFCDHYAPIEGRLGADWGACVNTSSEYFRTAVFEHWTCKEFKNGKIEE